MPRIPFRITLDVSVDTEAWAEASGKNQLDPTTVVPSDIQGLVERYLYLSDNGASLDRVVATNGPTVTYSKEL